MKDNSSEMPGRRTKSDLFEVTCGGNRWEGALTFHDTATQTCFTQKHVAVSNAALFFSISHTLVQNVR